MKEKYKKLIAVLCILSAVSLVLSIILLWKKNMRSIDKISDTVISGDNIILSNSDEENNISVIVIDSEGNEIYTADYLKKTALNEVFIYNSCTDLITDDDNVFVHIILYDGDNQSIIKEKVMFCNFENGSLEDKWDIPVDKNTQINALNCRIINGKLYYVSVNDDTVSLNCLDNNNAYSSEMVLKTDISDITEWFITDDFKLVGYSSYQGIFEFSDNGISRVYPLNNESDISIVNFGCDNEGCIYFTDLICGKNIKYDSGMNLSESNDIQYSMSYTLINLADYNLEKQGNVDSSELKNISYQSEGNFSAVYDSDGKSNKIAVFKNGSLVIFDNINLKTIKYNKLFKYFLICFIITGACFSLFYFYYKKKKYISVPVKVSLFSLLIMFVGVIMIKDNLEETLSKKFRQDAYSIMLADISSMYCNKESMNDFKDIYEFSLGTDNFIAPLHYKFYGTDENDNFIIMNNKGGMENVPAEYVCSIKSIEAFRQSLENYTPVLITESDGCNEYYALIYPIHGDVENFIVEVSIEKYIYDELVKKCVNIISIAIVVCLLLLILIFSFILKFALKPIEVLVKQIKNNNVKEEKRNDNYLFKDEIRDIKIVFENMIANISEYQIKMKNNNETYYKFLPSEIFSIFGRNNISELKSGDNQKVMFYNMYIDLQNSDISLLEKNYSDLLLKEEKSEYIIETFNMKYMEVSFRYKPENIVRHMSEFIQQFSDIYIGISYGVSLMAITGGEERLQAIIISKHKKIASILSDIGRKYDRNLIVSEYFLKTIPDYEKFFSVRYTGDICIDGEYIKIYDIINVSKDNDKIIYTKKDFEKGVNYFIKKDFYNAGLCFAEVLKYNRNDNIAKEYLNMSEIYLSGSVIPETDILSEKREKY